MHFSFGTGDAAKARADLLIVPLFDTEFSDAKQQPKVLTRLDKKTRGLLLAIAAQEGFKGKADQAHVHHTQGKLPAQRVMLLGLGSRPKFSPEVLRLALGKAAKAALKLKAKSAAVQLPVIREAEAQLRAIVEGLVLGGYKYDKWRTTNQDEKAAPRLDKVTLLLPEGEKKQKSWDGIVELARRVGEAQNWARDLVNEPAGTLTPTLLAQQARTLVKDAGLTVTVGDRKKIEALKMGMFLGVARGSVEEPCLIQVSYIPQDAAAQKATPVCFVGKAITFDSGGLSLKPSESMMDMKTDMAGSAAVLGAMKVIAHLAPPFPVHAYMGACENMPSGHAYRLGDVLVSRLGKTVEITNTDAEGRLVLGDVLAYAAEQKPAMLVDLATLTGACMVALGNYVAGAFGDDDQLVWNVLAAARHAGEELWRLPHPRAAEGRAQERNRRHEEQRRALGRGHQRRGLPQGVRRPDAVGAPGHRRALAEPARARLPLQGRHRLRRAHPGGAGAAPRGRAGHHRGPRRAGLITGLHAAR